MLSWQRSDNVFYPSAFQIPVTGEKIDCCREDHYLGLREGQGFMINSSGGGGSLAGLLWHSRNGVTFLFSPCPTLY
jgi:hypothetical protein